MGIVKVTFAKNYACKRGLMVRFARLKGLVWTGELGQFLLCGIQNPVNFFFGIQNPGACFSKVPIINGPGKLSPFSLKIEVSIVLHVT